MAVTEPVPVVDPGPRTRGERRTAADGGAAEGILRRQAQRESAARTYARSLPIVPVRARGLTIEGADGRRYLDCLSGAGTLALGHNHPVVLDALRQALDSGAPLHATDLATPVKDAFVTELFATLPAALAADARIRFCAPNGTDAVETALTLVRAATGRDGVLALDGARHEVPDAADPAPAGMLVEPVQDGGMIPAPDGWLRRLRELTAARSIPLIADETRTGVGRTGAFWGIGHSGVAPDVMVLSHAIGGSLPLAVVVHRAALDVPAPGPGAGTFRGNQLAMAAGAATLAYVRENGLAERAGALGTRILDRLRALAADHPCVGDVRGRGLMTGVALVDPEASGTRTRGAGAQPPPAPGLAAELRRRCLDRGLIVGLGGRHQSVVRLLPPLTLTDEQAAAVLDRFADALAAAERAHRACRNGPVGPPG
ncbi:aminotransferase class III-fold pyridoxal phosphate-dependent enzyme [Streptomyces sp. NPDC090025]|uniref:aminotransferase class III-fold pyridoxal phosphate-dependent enzyme n=1 Tax=Streptomyces sp. NPDC090025 TaxID=3365922 RepID=UPI003833863B